MPLPLQDVPTWELIRELEARGFFSQMVKAMLGAAPTPVSADLTQMPKIPVEPPADKVTILKGLFARLDASKDTREVEDVDGGPTRYIVHGQEKDILREYSTQAALDLANDPSTLPSQREEILRTLQLRQDSAAQPLGAAGAIAANLKAGAEAAFIQPSLPGVPGQGATSDEIRRGWVRLNEVAVSVPVGDSATFRKLAAAVATDCSLGGTSVQHLMLSSSLQEGHVRVSVPSEVARLVHVMARFLQTGPAARTLVDDIYTQVLGACPLWFSLPKLQLFQSNPLAAADECRLSAMAYIDSATHLPSRQRSYLKRFLNPDFREMEIPAGSADRAGSADLREAWEKGPSSDY